MNIVITFTDVALAAALIFVLVLFIWADQRRVDFMTKVGKGFIHAADVLFLIAVPYLMGLFFENRTSPLTWPDWLAAALVIGLYIYFAARILRGYVVGLKARFAR